MNDRLEMLDQVIEAIKITAEETAEALYSQNQMGWKGKREQFVNSFLESFRDNYTTQVCSKLFEVA